MPPPGSSEWLAPHGVEITGVHTAGDPARGDRAKLRRSSSPVATASGWSRALHRLSLIDPVRSAIDRGVPYFGASAGANVACPTIRTTNDMPIVQPPSFAAFNLVPFQVNPHYIDPPPPEARIGETREERLMEFLEENDGDRRRAPRAELAGGRRRRRCALRGTGGAVLFRRGAEPAQVGGGADLSSLLLETPRYDV